MKTNSKTIRLLSCLVLSIFVAGCIDNDKDLDAVNESIYAIQKDELFYNLKESIQNREEEIIDKTFDFSSLDRKIINEGLQNCKTKEDFIDLYRKAGMKNADEYFNSITDQINSINSIAKRFPQISKMSSGERKLLLRPMQTGDTVRYNSFIKSKITSGK